MHIGIVGPIDTANVADFLDCDIATLPRGYSGAPLLGTLIGELLKCGHRVSAFTLSSDMPLDRVSCVTATGRNFSISYCQMRPRAWRSNGPHLGRIVDLYRIERRALADAIIDANPDVIHAHWAYEFALAALASEIPHVITCHDSPFAIARMNSRSKPTVSAYRWLRTLMASKALRGAKTVTAVSPYMRDSVQRLASSTIFVVPNPIENSISELGRPRLVPQRPRLVMVCNGWDDRKNPTPALIAFAKFRDLRSNAELHLFGHGFEPGGIAESWCKARRLEAGMKFHGAVAHKKLLKQVSEFDVLLHPSIEESFGMVIAEAMAMGIPVVAGRTSGAVPWVVGEAIGLCDVRNSASILRAISLVLTPREYEKASREGMSSASERFSAKKVAAEYVALYELALHK